MNTLSNRIQQLKESATIAMAQKSRELQSSGIDIINLSLGEPDFDTPDFIKEAAKKAIDENFTHYMPVPGYPDLREAISNKFKRDNGLNYTPDQIVVSTGAKQSIANAVLSLVNPGDEVLLPAPFWVSYKEIVKLAEGIPVIIPAGIDHDFKVTAAQLEPHINTRTKLMIFSSPCNPSGSVYSAKELKTLADLFSRHKNISIISDEIYEYINFGEPHASIAAYDEIAEQVITVNGVSKGFAMTGWRIGYMGAPPAVAKACSKMQGQFTSGASGIAQRAALAAINADPVQATSAMREAFLKRRDLVLDDLKHIPGVLCNEPKGAFYIFPDISYYFGKSDGKYTIGNAPDLCLYLLEKAHVALVDGGAFGAPGCIRFSYAASEKHLVEAIKRMKKALGHLK